MGRRQPAQHRPRELRRKVLVPARLHTVAGWSDACILNVSSRGLLIHSKRSIAEGSRIELRHAEHAIVAHVVWREGAHAGLRAEHRVPVEDIVCLCQSPALQLTAPRQSGVERRKRPRTHEDSRLRSRAIEFTSIALFGAGLAAGAYSMVQHAFAQSLGAVRAALGG
jgi:hypothetical protein